MDTLRLRFLCTHSRSERREGLRPTRSGRSSLHRPQNRQKPLGGRFSKIELKLLRVADDSRGQALRPSRRRGHPRCRHLRRFSFPCRERHGRACNRLPSPGDQSLTHPWRKTLVLPRKLAKGLLKGKESGSVQLKVPMGGSESNGDVLGSACGSGWNGQTARKGSST
jgi:hypothetical protein